MELLCSIDTIPLVNAISEKLDTLQVSLLAKDSALSEAKVKISQELEDKASNALRLKEELGTNLELLNQCWQNEIRWKAKQLETAAAANAEVDLAQIEGHCVQIEDLLSKGHFFI